jgi:hypothetical protein
MSDGFKVGNGLKQDGLTPCLFNVGQQLYNMTAVSRSQTHNILQISADGGKFR